MNFTREPIIETIITPRDGCKLTIRNSKGGSQEEYFVDAIEVVSFGQSMFFRSQERPKSFLLPVTDYEVVEAKETRVVLKNAPLEGSIKIGGGKVQKVFKEPEEKTTAPAKPQQDEHSERPRRRKSSSRRRRIEGEAGENPPQRPPMEIKAPPLIQYDQEKKTPSPERVSGEEETPVSSSMFRNLFPPPTGLISEKIQHEKNLQAARDAAAGVVESKPVEEKESPQEKGDDPGDANASFSDFVEEEAVEESSSDSEADTDTPRYHSAPREDTDGPFFRAENNFVY